MITPARCTQLSTRLVHSCIAIRIVPSILRRKHPIKSPEHHRYKSMEVDINVVDGVTFRPDTGPMEVVFTPGHTSGHISLYFPTETFLIAGDALTADNGVITGPNEEYTPDMNQALQSATRLANRNIDRALCYHGSLVEQSSERIRKVVDALE